MRSSSSDRAPGGPASADPARPVRDAARALPVDADHVEARRRRGQRALPRAAEPHASSTSARSQARLQARRARRRPMASRSFIRHPQGAMPPSAPGSKDPPELQSLPIVRAFLAALGLALVLAAGASAAANREARARDPVRAGPRGQPGDAGLPDEPALEGRTRSLRRRGDPARHAGRPLDLDEDDLHGRAEREAAGDRLRVARRRAGRVCRRLDLGGGGRARDGADDEHRLVDADRLERREPRLRPAAQGDQRCGRLAHRACRGAQAQHDVAGAGGEEGVEPHSAASAAHARDRLHRADAAGAAREARRLQDEGHRAALRAASRGRAHRLHEAPASSRAS